MLLCRPLALRSGLLVTEQPESPPAQPPSTGLATVALLKTNFDAGRDHIDMFQPFVLDAAKHHEEDGFSVIQLQSTLQRRRTLHIPEPTLRTLLTRAARQRFLRREAGRYFRTEKLHQAADPLTPLDSIQERQTHLASALRAHATSKGIDLPSDESALQIFLDFISRYHVQLALSEESDIEPVSDDDNEDPLDSNHLLVAGFLKNTLLKDKELTDIVQEILEGYVLQNALLLKDISLAPRRFKDLDVHLDTGVLLGALAFRGPEIGQTTRQTLSLLRETGARLSVFEDTIREMKGILSIYETRLGTLEGQLSLRPTDVTRYLLTNHFTPSDVREAAALTEHNLQRLGINIRSRPARLPAYTLHEEGLARRLADREGGERDPRVEHDVDCVAAILTLRVGRQSDSFDTAHAVFMTTSGLTAKTVTQWYEDEGGAGVPPIVHYLTLSNLAWIKRPASASDLKLNELIALCVAALRPSSRTWSRFLDYLQNLRDENTLTSDELAAIVASELTDRALSEDIVVDDPDAETLSEVVHRVKESYKEETNAQLLKAKGEASQAAARARQQQLAVASRARWIAQIAVRGAATVITLALILGALFSILSMLRGRLGILGAVLASVFILGSLPSMLWGFNVSGWRQAQEEKLARRIQSWLLSLANTS